jgi:uncharacterized protein YjbJ (UPF0337 family)
MGKEAAMNRDRMEGLWKQVRGRIQEEWGRFLRSDRDIVRGRRKQLVGRIQELYGLLKNQAEREVIELERRVLAGVRPRRVVRARVRVVRRRSARRS